MFFAESLNTKICKAHKTLQSQLQKKFQKLKMRGYFIGNFLYFLHIHLWLPEFRENQSKFTTKSETTIAYRLMKKTDSQNIMPQTL